MKLLSLQTLPLLPLLLLMGLHA